MNKKFSKNNIPFILFLLFLFSFIFNSKIMPVLIAALILFFIFKKLILPRIEKYKAANKNMNQTIDLDNLKAGPKAKKAILSIVVIIFALWLFFASIIIVDAGETGVYSLFGKVKDQELSSGFHLVIPLAKVTKMSIRTEEYTMSIAQGEGKKYSADAITSLTKEGLSVDLDMTVLYRLQEDKASDVYRELGLNFDEKIIRPTIRTSIRDVIAQYEAKDIYSAKREEAAFQITDNLKAVMDPRGIIIESVLLRNVALPANLANAIQEKLQAEQEAEKYDFILAKEKKEKERKIIEAEGQQESQRIINQSLTTNYLYYLYINQLKDREGTIYVPTSPTTGMPVFKELGR
ncbi:prohibitin family protein [Candidatus Falkowbacteria bacterium]|nr:prohibitin family protein [Candidatus Falkowbacteria bacterium]